MQNSEKVKQIVLEKVKEIGPENVKFYYEGGWQVDNKIFQEPAATTLENLRDKRRELRRITYDCFSAHLRGDSVVCTKGKTLSAAKSGTMPLLTCPKGGSTPMCVACKDYSGD